MIRVLIITESVMPNKGSGRTGANVISGLNARGIRVAVLSEDIPENPESNVQYKLLKPHRQSLLSFIRNIYMARKMARKYDVVHALDMWPYGVYGYFAVLWTKKKFFVNGIGTYSVAPLYRFGINMLVRWAYHRAESIFCISRYVCERIRERVPDAALEMVHLGATLLPCPNDSAVQALKARLRLFGCAPLILTVGEIKHRKGQLDTLKAVSLLTKEHPNVCYLMVGNSQDALYRQQIEHYAQENGVPIRIVTDIVRDDELAACYALANVFALNSNNTLNHFEGFGHVLIEAAQFGLPSVGSSGCGIEDAIREGYNGLRVPQGDVREIANRLRQILMNWEYFSKNAREYATHFSWETTVAYYCSRYRTV